MEHRQTVILWYPRVQNMPFSTWDYFDGVQDSFKGVTDDDVDVSLMSMSTCTAIEKSQARMDICRDSLRVFKSPSQKLLVGTGVVALRHCSE